MPQDTAGTGDRGTKPQPDITVCNWTKLKINGNNQTQKYAIDSNRTQPDTTDTTKTKNRHN